eukprot:1151031-Pelagomonas_calceolata.AAC.7
MDCADASLSKGTREAVDNGCADASLPEGAGQVDVGVVTDEPLRTCRLWLLDCADTSLSKGTREVSVGVVTDEPLRSCRLWLMDCVDASLSKGTGEMERISCTIRWKDAELTLARRVSKKANAV